MRFKRDTDEDSREGRLARQLVIAKQEADALERELDALPRWRRRADRAALSERLRAAREREHELLEGLGAKPRA
jgi:hypothetical protein